MNEAAVLQNYLIVGAILFGLGLIGFLVRRNLIVMFMCVEMMLQGISLNLIAWSRFHADWGGQMIVVFIITVAACEAGIALALVLMLCKHVGNLDIMNWQQTHEENLEPFIDAEVPADDTEDQTWPSLTPAGIEPEVAPEERMHRTHV